MKQAPCYALHAAGQLENALSGLIAVSILQVWHADGFKGFYKGCGTNLLRTTPAAALTFTSFELINRQIKIYAQAKRQHRIDELTSA